MNRKKHKAKKPHTAGCWSGKGTESALLRYLFPGFSVDAKHGWTDTVVIVSVLTLSNARDFPCNFMPEGVLIT